MSIILITGGCRSGKSSFAQKIAEQLHINRFYIATAEPLDEEMKTRIKHHQKDRDETWTTVETPILIAEDLDQNGCVVVDCLTLWITNLMMHSQDDLYIQQSFEQLCSKLKTVDNDVILITNEVGWGIVPLNAMSRSFRDHSGRLSQNIAKIADHVALCVAGIPLWIKGGFNV